MGNVGKTMKLIVYFLLKVIQNKYPVQCAMCQNYKV